MQHSLPLFLAIRGAIVGSSIVEKVNQSTVKMTAASSTLAERGLLAKILAKTTWAKRDVIQCQPCETWLTVSTECIKWQYLSMLNPKYPIFKNFSTEKQCEELELGFFPFLLTVSEHLACIQVTPSQTQVTYLSHIAKKTTQKSRAMGFREISPFQLLRFKRANHCKLTIHSQRLAHFPIAVFTEIKDVSR